MRSLCLLLFSAAALVAQPIGFGLKGGLPLNDFLKTARTNNIGFDTTTNRYIVGPSLELRLPHGLGIELDVLYRHFGYSSFFQVIANSSNAQTSTSAWEFPLVGKYKLRKGLVSPYVEAGVSWDRLSGLTQAVKSTVGLGATTSTTTSSPAELNKTTTRGFVMGAGLDIKALVIHITPEIRYTRWGAKHFISGDLLNSNQNQGEFLIGFKF
jgi:opacity protein-like surface antigen